MCHPRYVGKLHTFSVANDEHFMYFICIDYVPGLVDAHTHPVWAGDRVHEFSMKVYTVYVD